MQRLSTRIPELVLLAPVVHGDERGFFLETYRQSVLTEAGVAEDFVQDNHSRSRRGVVRGMHFQPGMGKLVRCARGEIFDVAVDVRPDSPRFGQWEGFLLDDVEHRQLYVPDGFAHGFCVLSETADVVYKCTTYYDAESEGGFSFRDPAVGIEWPAGVELTPSARDAEAGPLAQVAGAR